MLTPYSAREKWRLLENEGSKRNRKSYEDAAEDARKFAEVVVTCDSQYCKPHSAHHSP